MLFPVKSAGLCGLHINWKLGGLEAMKLNCEFLALNLKLTIQHSKFKFIIFLICVIRVHPPAMRAAREARRVGRGSVSQYFSAPK
jgi:hypothetical protein